MSRRSERAREAEDYLRRSAHDLMGLAIAITGQRADAEDLLQETLATVVVKWDRIRHATDPDAYVRRVMVNTMISGRRRRWRTEIVSSPATEHEHRHVPAPDIASQVSGREEVLALIRGLPPRQRAVVGLRYYADLPDAAIASLLGCSAQAVRSAAHAALGSLRTALSATSER